MTKSKILSILVIVLALIGFIDAAYITAEHYLERIPPCSVLKGCETVLTSKYAAMWGIPVALVGAIYYGTVFILAINYFQNKKRELMTWVNRLTGLGLLASAGFVYLQVFVIEALCLYCIISAITTASIFIISLFDLKLRSNN